MNSEQIKKSINILRDSALRSRGQTQFVTIPPGLRLGAMVTSGGRIFRITLESPQGNPQVTFTDWYIIVSLWGFPNLSPLNIDGVLTCTWSSETPPKDTYQDYPKNLRDMVRQADLWFIEALLIHRDNQAEAEILRTQANDLLEKVDGLLRERRP